MDRYQSVVRETPPAEGFHDEHDAIEKVVPDRVGKKASPIQWSGVRYLQDADGKPFVVEYKFTEEYRWKPGFHCYVRQEDLERGILMAHSVTEEIKRTTQTIISGDGEDVVLERPYHWEEVVLPESMKNTLKCQVIEFFGKRAKFEALGLPFKRGVFLYGPPGNGKTMVGKVLASQAPANFIWVTPRNIDRLSPVKGLAAVFELARLIAPTIVFVEDVDLMGGGSREVEFKALLGELLNQLDGVVENNGIITIATTNNIEMMDKALASRPGRFDLKLEFPNPDRIGRETLLRRALAKADVDGESMMEGVEATEGCSGAQTCEVAYRAMLLAVERGGEEDRTIAVTGSLLEESARLVRGKRKVVGFVQSANGNGNAPSRSVQEVSPV